MEDVIECAKCKNSYDRDNFLSQKGGGRLNKLCRACQQRNTDYYKKNQQYHRDYKIKNKQKINNYTRQWYRKHKAKKDISYYLDDLTKDYINRAVEERIKVLQKEFKNEVLKNLTLSFTG